MQHVFLESLETPPLLRFLSLIFLVCVKLDLWDHRSNGLAEKVRENIFESSQESFNQITVFTASASFRSLQRFSALWLIEFRKHFILIRLKLIGRRHFFHFQTVIHITLSKGWHDSFLVLQDRFSTNIEILIVLKEETTVNVWIAYSNLTWKCLSSSKT